MKKILLSIFGIFFGLISFSSADYVFTGYNYSYNLGYNDINVNGSTCEVLGCTFDQSDMLLYTIPDWYINYNRCFNAYTDDEIILYLKTENSCLSDYLVSYSENTFTCGEDLGGGHSFYPCLLSSGSSSSPSSSDITVFYDYGHSSTSVACNGDNSIFINGMANVSNQTTFTPFFNISYVDEDNQNLIESYSKDMLYLDNGQFKKTYTGDNQWILTVQNQGGSTPDIIFTGETLPVLVTGDSDNVFSNFGDNALMLISSNIPGIITWGFILFIILFIIRLFIPKNRR